MEIILIVIIIIAVASLRRWWLPILKTRVRVLRLFAFLVLLFCTIGGLFFWYRWNVPKQTFYGVFLSSIQVEDLEKAQERSNRIYFYESSGTGIALSDPRTEPEQIVITETGSIALPSVPFWKHVGIAPEIVVPKKFLGLVSAEGLLEVSIIGRSQSMVLPSEYLSRTKENELLVTLDPPSNFSPGKYRMEVRLAQRGESFGESRILYAQDFTWGVLAFNPDSDVYAPGETGQLQIGVLDDEGVTLCDATVTIRITSPSGKEKLLSTEGAGGIRRNPLCKDKAVTDVPDFSASVEFSERGTYTFLVSADTRNGVRSILEKVNVVGRNLPDIKRRAMARIFPLAPYPMRITVTPSHDFDGNITDKVPASFVIISSTPQAVISIDSTTKESTLTWKGTYRKGIPYVFEYVYDAPDISPAFYLLGPLKIDGELVTETLIKP